MALVDGLAKIVDVPAHLTWPERVALYALVLGIRPHRVLEIGTLYGGSACVISQAMDDADRGALWCIDPNPQVSPDIWSRIQHRAKMFKAKSPEGLRDIYSDAKAPFDLAFIDGDHEQAGLCKDIAGVLPILRPGGLMILHDAHFGPVDAAIRESLSMSGGHLLDMGLIVDNPQPDQINPGIFWGGLRVLCRRGS